jgi:hypothetical protein
MEKTNNKGSQFTPPPEERQHLDKKAEEYLREGGNIEDMPNASEEDDEQKLIKQLKEHQEGGKVDRKQSDSEKNDK